MSKKTKSKNKNVKFKKGKNEAEDGEIISEDSDPENTAIPDQATPVTDLTVEDASTIEGTEKTVSNTAVHDVGNLSTDTIEEDITQLFGLNSTKYLRDSCTVQLVFKSKSKFKRYAYLDIPSHVAVELLKVDGFEFNSRKLVLQKAKNSTPNSKFDKSTHPYDRGGMLRGRDK